MAYNFFNERQHDYLQKGFGYTDRQMHIIELICRRLNNVGVAKVAKITYNTAKTHVRNICRKAHAHSRAELILTLIAHSRHLAFSGRRYRPQKHTASVHLPKPRIKKSRPALRRPKTRPHKKHRSRK